MLASGSEGHGFNPRDGQGFSKAKKVTIDYERSGDGRTTILTIDTKTLVTCDDTKTMK